MKNLTITPCKQNSKPESKPRFNIGNAKKCGAKTRQALPCQSPAMKNGRCRMHGGKSTGAKTKAGIERIKKANFRNGLYTKEMILGRIYMASLIKESKIIMEKI
jgi:hypothetical protein